jgi:hypothetical protein
MQMSIARLMSSSRTWKHSVQPRPRHRMRPDSSADANAFGKKAASSRSASRSQVSSVPSTQTRTCPPERVSMSMRDHRHARPTLRTCSRRQ